MATIIHHTRPFKNSLPLPRTRLLTNFPSSSATYRLIIVLNTKKMLWLMISLNSLLLHPGMQILSNRRRFLKNSRFSSTFFLPVASPSLGPVPVFLCASRRIEAAFCSAIALRTRFMRATKSVRYTAREIRVRFCRYKEVKSLTSDLIEALDMRCFDQGFDRTAMATVGEAIVVRRVKHHQVPGALAEGGGGVAVGSSWSSIRTIGLRRSCFSQIPYM